MASTASSSRRPRGGTLTLANTNGQNPLFQADILDHIFSYFEHERPEMYPKLRLVCKPWNQVAARWIRKATTWRIDRADPPHGHLYITNERKFMELIANYEGKKSGIPHLFTNFHISHDNTGNSTLLDSFSNRFVSKISPQIVDLQLTASRRSYIDFYLPPSASELRRLELYTLSEAPFPEGKTATDFAFGNTVYPKLEAVTFRGKPHDATVQICINLLRNASNLEELTLTLDTRGICQVIKAAASGDLDLTKLTTFKTVHGRSHKKLPSIVPVCPEELSAHIPEEEVRTLGHICPKLTEIAIAVSDTETATEALISTLNHKYAQQLLNLKLVVRERGSKWRFYSHQLNNTHYHLVGAGTRHNTTQGRQEGADVALHELQVEMAELQRIMLQIRNRTLEVAEELGNFQRDPQRQMRLPEFQAFPALTRLCLKNWRLNNDFSMFKKMPCLKIVDLDVQMSGLSYVYPVGMAHSKVSIVRFEDVDITEGTIEALASTFPNMTTLEITDPVKDAYIRIWQALPNLKRLKFCRGKRERLRDVDPSLDSALTGIPEETLDNILANPVSVSTAAEMRTVAYVGNLSNLEELSIDVRGHGLTQAAFDYGFAFLPALRRLKIKMIQIQAPVSVKAVVDNCPVIRRLDLRDDSMLQQCKIRDIEYAKVRRLGDVEIVPTGRSPYDDEDLLPFQIGR